MSIFIVGDVHGNYKSLISSLEKSGCDVNADTIIFVGDVVDRGRENAKVVNFIAEHKGNIHLICGNHEYQHRQLLKILPCSCQGTGNSEDGSRNFPALYSRRQSHPR